MSVNLDKRPILNTINGKKFEKTIASIEYIRRQIEKSFTSCIKGLIRKFTEIHILTIQSGVKKTKLKSRWAQPHKQNFFNAFVRFSWCFEGKGGICLVVYNLHLITMILFYHRNVRMDRKVRWLYFFFLFSMVKFYRKKIHHGQIWKCEISNFSGKKNIFCFLFHVR
jgi:hypothetical protein